MIAGFPNLARVATLCLSAGVAGAAGTAVAEAPCAALNSLTDTVRAAQVAEISDPFDTASPALPVNRSCGVTQEISGTKGYYCAWA